jgi:hypothetical protein
MNDDTPDTSIVKVDKKFHDSGFGRTVDNLGSEEKQPIRVYKMINSSKKITLEEVLVCNAQQFAIGNE